MSNTFLRSIDFYERRLSPLKQYVHQCSLYLSRMTGQSLETCLKYVMSVIRQEGVLNNPTVRYYERNEYGDKSVQELTLLDYLKQIEQQKEVLAPSFTTYLNSEQLPSLLVEFTDNNKRRRSIAKKEAFKAKAAGQMDLFTIKNNEQTNMKLYNNSLSGAFATKGSVLYNPTAHSTLTSITRTTVSISNASNEKMLEGNRHYYNPEVTLYNLISILSILDSQQLSTMLTRYQLVYPTVDDVMSMIKRSTDLYWHDRQAMEHLRNSVAHFSPIERAALVYTGDLYHIKQHNPEFIHRLLSELSRKVTDTTLQQPLDILQSTDEAIINLVHHICIAEMRGKGKDYSTLPFEHQQTLAATCLHIQQTLKEYQDFIEAVFLTANFPNSIAMIPNMVRRAVVVSDTDSTLFSVDTWVQWYFETLDFNDHSYALAATVMFLTTQCMAHSLAMLSANMNVPKAKLFDLAMKPEYTFPVFVQTPVAKHYFALINVVEGNVYATPEKEIKGANLKSSSNARAVIQHAQEQMTRILMTIYDNQKLSLVNELTSVASLERAIKDSLLKGEVDYYKHSKIKQPEAYASKPEQSPYVHHLLWREVFEPAYGTIEEPPYSVIKIPTIVNNITQLKQWLLNIEDTVLKERLEAWLLKHRKTSLPTLYLSDLHVQAFGMPKEIQSVIDVKRIILDLTGTQRMILDSIGYTPKTGFLLSEIGY